MSAQELYIKRCQHYQNTMVKQGYAGNGSKLGERAKRHVALLVKEIADAKKIWDMEKKNDSL